MWPYGVGAAIVALFALQSASGAPASAAGQEHMLFRDYAWIVMMPSTAPNPGAQGSTINPEATASNVLTQGTMNPAVIATLPPPPGCAPGSGVWSEYPEGYTCAFTGPRAATLQPGTDSNAVIPVWPNVPQGMSIYQWLPVQNVLTKLNGYYVICTKWVFAHPGSKQVAGFAPGTTAPALPSAIPGHVPGGPSGPYVYTQMPAIVVQDAVPAPPPGESSHSGSWHMVQPGYCVWLTPQNTNNATLAVQAFADPQLASYLAQSGTGGGTLPNAPSFSAQPTY